MHALRTVVGSFLLMTMGLVVTVPVTHGLSVLGQNNATATSRLLVKVLVPETNMEVRLQFPPTSQYIRFKNLYDVIQAFQFYISKDGGGHQPIRDILAKSLVFPPSTGANTLTMQFSAEPLAVPPTTYEDLKRCLKVILGYVKEHRLHTAFDFEIFKSEDHISIGDGKVFPRATVPLLDSTGNSTGVHK